MVEGIPINKEGKEAVEDNARKFRVNHIGQDFLEKSNASSFILIVDWLEMGEENEKKLAYKKFENGDIQILLISKTTLDGKRTSEKKRITQEEYEELIDSSALHLQKKRYEFKAIQGDTSFSFKYDEFAEGKVCLLEVDANTEDERNRFDPNDFLYDLSEVTGDIRYYGYRVADMV